ncbi:MAG: hypothetical protein Devi2KO_40370 [Devosia indica]
MDIEMKKKMEKKATKIVEEKNIIRCFYFFVFYSVFFLRQREKGGGDLGMLWKRVFVCVFFHEAPHSVSDAREVENM